MKAKPAGNTLLANHILFFANDKMEEINVDLKQWKKYIIPTVFPKLAWSPSICDAHICFVDLNVSCLLFVFV
jgi:hypothetical protein